MPAGDKESPTLATPVATGLRWVDEAPASLRELVGPEPDDPDVGIAVQDFHGAIVACNEAATRILGLSWEQMVGRTSMDPRWVSVSASGTPLEGSEHPAMVALATGRDLEDVMGVDAPEDGRFVWLSVIIKLVRRPEGEIVGVQSRFRDVSAETVGREATQRSVRALRHAAQDAKEAEVRFRLVAENSADVLFQTDLEGLCTWVSPSVRLVLGWEVEDLLGGNPLDLVHPDDARLVRFHLPILSDSTPNSLEIRFATVGEGYRWMSAISRELHGRSGELVGCLYALRDVEEQVQRREQLAYRASHDALTGLVNRTEAMEALAEALERAKLKHTWVGLLYVDIDHFKAVNDTYGHLEGDRLLIRVAQLLKDTLRETDVVARIGGDEFIAVLPSMREPDIAVVRAEALLATVSQPGDPDFPQASLSIGVAVGDGSHDADQLLAMADAALYRAKTGGRNRLSQS